jgi:ornithine cyclodeaminase/alanine dehydrogenase-like protein (mu-crystallin family)
VGFRYLARKDAKAVGLFGSAGQAANQLLALKCERPITHVKIYSRNPENRRKFAEKYAPMFNLDITPVDSPRNAVKGVDVIACATNTNSVLFDGDWLEPGQHVTGIIGSNVALVKAGFLRSRRREIDDKTAVRADVIVTNLRESVMSEEQGDLFEPLEKGLIPLEKIHELSELATRAVPGRTSDKQITYHKNNNGLGCADLAIAMRAYELAKQQGRGITIDCPPPGAQ